MSSTIFNESVVDLQPATVPVAEESNSSGQPNITVSEITDNVKKFLGFDCFARAYQLRKGGDRGSFHNFATLIRISDLRSTGNQWIFLIWK